MYKGPASYVRSYEDRGVGMRSGFSDAGEDGVVFKRESVFVFEASAFLDSVM